MIKVKEYTHFKWIHVIAPTESELGTIASTYHIHSTSLHDCLDAEHPAKYEKFENHYFLLIRYLDPELPKNFEHMEKVTKRITRKMAFFIAENFILTLERKNSFATEHVEEKNSGFTSPLEIYLWLVAPMVKTFQDHILSAYETIELIESQLWGQTKMKIHLHKIHLLKRKHGIIQHHLRQSLDAHLKISCESGCDQKKIRPIIHDLKDDFERAIHKNQHLIDEAASLFQLFISFSAQKTNQTMETLTVLSAFFLPLTFLAGVYGMNFHWMPELQWTYGYPALWTVFILISLVQLLIFKRKRLL